MTLTRKQGLLSGRTGQPQHQPTPGHAAPARRCRQSLTQGVENQVAHGRPVPGAGKSAGPSPVRQRLLGGVACKHPIQDGDGRCKSCRRGHPATMLKVIAPDPRFFEARQVGMHAFLTLPKKDWGWAVVQG